MATPVRIALVGLGWWGKKMPAVLQAAPDAIEVVRAVEPGVQGAPAEPVKDNLVAFARAVRGIAPYAITSTHLTDNIALLEAVFKSSRSGQIEYLEAAA